MGEGPEDSKKSNDDRQVSHCYLEPYSLQSSFMSISFDLDNNTVGWLSSEHPGAGHAVGIQ